mmetsp:Transcript_10556/g.30154  ORF Transcript_10556/g.30154 Transcript_10556/m.30154 type:complete len:209 (+) Transcript_10556:1174-1800(+)
MGPEPVQRSFHVFCSVLECLAVNREDQIFEFGERRNGVVVTSSLAQKVKDVVEIVFPGFARARLEGHRREKVEIRHEVVVIRIKSLRPEPVQRTFHFFCSVFVGLIFLLREECIHPLELRAVVVIVVSFVSRPKPCQSTFQVIGSGTIQVALDSTKLIEADICGAIIKISPVVSKPTECLGHRLSVFLLFGLGPKSWDRWEWVVGVIK